VPTSEHAAQSFSRLNGLCSGIISMARRSLGMFFQDTIQTSKKNPGKHPGMPNEAFEFEPISDPRGVCSWRAIPKHPCFIVFPG